MSVEFAYRYKQDAPPSDLRDLDVVALTAAVQTDDGGEMPAGSIGTVVSILPGGQVFAVEFDEPEWAMANVYGDQLRFVERAPA